VALAPVENDSQNRASCPHAQSSAQVLEVVARGARLRLPHLGSLELILAIAEAYSHYVFAPHVPPNPPVRRPSLSLLRLAQ